MKSCITISSNMEDGSGSDSDSGSSSESDDENGPELESSAGPDVPSESSSDLPSPRNLSAARGAQANQRQDFQKPGTVSPLNGNQTEKKTTSTNSATTENQDVKPKKKSFNSLKDFPLDPIYSKWYCDENDNIFRTTIKDLGLKRDKVYIKRLVNLLGSAADIICELSRGEKEFYKNLHIHYNIYFGNTPNDERPIIEKFDNCLYDWAVKVWPRALYIIYERCRR